MRKPETLPVSPAICGECCDESWKKKWPNIVAYLTDGAWDDGSERELSTLTVSFADGECRLALNDRALSQSLYTAAESFVTAMGLMDGALGAGKGRWRPWKSGSRRKGS